MLFKLLDVIVHFVDTVHVAVEGHLSVSSCLCLIFKSREAGKVELLRSVINAFRKYSAYDLRMFLETNHTHRALY